MAASAPMPLNHSLPCEGEDEGSLLDYVPGDKIYSSI